jgi:quinol monooxygenase YgiN
MAYVRLSIARPVRGQAERVEKLMRELADSASRSQGCLASYLLRARDDSGEIGRVAIYEDEAAADATANDAHIMALRSELHLHIEPGHVERSFVTI